MEVLLFGGTSEGRILAEWLSARGTCDVVACTATDYGASLVEGNDHVSVVLGPLDANEKMRLVQEHDFSCVIDATHPYAEHISDSIDKLARDCSLDVVRVVREEQVAYGAHEGVLAFSTVREAADHLATTRGNVLLTTGAKELETFARRLPDYAERLYVRILPVGASLAKVEALGIPVSHIVAMQGPFSVELNAALMHELDISYLVTKESGSAGGFAQKLEAAQQCGVKALVVKRPPQHDGVLVQEAMALLEDRYGV